MSGSWPPKQASGSQFPPTPRPHRLISPPNVDAKEEGALRPLRPRRVQERCQMRLRARVRWRVFSLLLTQSAPPRWSAAYLKTVHLLFARTMSVRGIMPRFAWIGVTYGLVFTPNAHEITDSPLRDGRSSPAPASNESIWPLQIFCARILQRGQSMSVPAHRGPWTSACKGRVQILRSGVVHHGADLFV